MNSQTYTFISRLDHVCKVIIGLQTRFCNLKGVLYEKDAHLHLIRLLLMTALYGYTQTPSSSDATETDAVTEAGYEVVSVQ